MAIKSTEQEKSFQFVHGTRILGRRRRVLNSQNAVDSSSTLQKREEIGGLNWRGLISLNHCPEIYSLMFYAKWTAALIAGETHHWCTPVKSILKGPKISENYENIPSEPKQNRVARSRIEGKVLASVAVALFSNDEDWGPFCK
ncbi:hypothetical protein LUZ60_010608 [Juncus effusus]|nr:hypothetical protein LUZ60_010608 [Juncus effusus]